MTAIGRPGDENDSCPSIRWTCNSRPTMLISPTPSGTVTRIASPPTGATALTPPGPAPPLTRSTRLGLPAELGEHDRPRQHRFGGRHGSAGQILDIASAPRHLGLGIGMTAVQREGHGRGAAMRRNHHDDTVGDPRFRSARHNRSGPCPHRHRAPTDTAPRPARPAATAPRAPAHHRTRVQPPSTSPGNQTSTGVAQTSSSAHTVTCDGRVLDTLRCPAAT